MLKNTFFHTKKTINCRGKILSLGSPVVMGIINLTPDSFYDGGRLEKNWDIIKHAGRLLEEGAVILDMGAASTRPGADLVDPSLELRRLLPALELIKQNYPEAIISVDTYNSITAKEAIQAGAHIINDVSAGAFDPLMFETVADLQVPYIIMHMKGTPKTMQDNPVYTDVVREVSLYFSQKVHVLRDLGVHDIILDPGFGFAKTLEDNYRLLDKLEYFKILELPILAGMSRKSMVNKVLSTSPQKALNGTTVLNTIALLNGASVLRVHDAKEAQEAIKIVEMLNKIKD